MKKVLSFAIVLSFLVMIPYSFVIASTPEASSQRIVYYADGSYLIEVTSYYDKGDNSTSSIRGTLANIRNGSRTYTYYGSDGEDDGEEKWVATLLASFTYDGSSSVCTAAPCNVTISSNGYYLGSKIVEKHDNVASADITIDYRIFGITISTMNYIILLSCDSNGNLI